MRINYVLAISIISICLSCNNGKRSQQKENHQTGLTSVMIDFDKIINLQLSDMIDSLRYIPLETTQESYLGNIDKFIWYKDNFFVLDQSAKTVFCFSQNGKFLYKIRREGKGPGEYLGISDMIINPFKNTLEILDRNSSKILCYDLSTQESTGSIPINCKAKDFIVTDPSSYYLFTMGVDYFGGMKDLKYNLLQVDSSGVNLRGKYFEAYEGSSAFGFSSMLSRVNDTTALFSYFYNDTIYEINRNRIIPKYFIDFGKNTLPVNMAKMDVEQIIEILNKNDFASHLNTLFETDKVLYFHYEYKHKIRKVLYYKNSHEFINFNYVINNDMDGIPLADVKTIRGDYMLFAISPIGIEKFIPDNKKEVSVTKSLLSNIKINDNPIMVMGKLR